MKNPNDKRVIKTRKLIIETFKSMIIEMEYSEITIKNLAERANINRKTFYAHFECIEDVLDELSEEIADILYKNMMNKRKQRYADEVLTLSESILNNN